MLKSGNFEILAPAGSIEQLEAAVNNGCDSVYLGLDSFNARMKAPNFNAENLGYWVNYCHFFGVKVYVAVNTSVKNNEFSKAVETLFCAYKSNADGVIVTDLALLKIAASLPKPFEVVASTQLNAHDSYGARFLRNLGADTVVCARETSLKDIRDIAKEGVKVEAFLHGALCVCQSGQCLFSSMVGGNSGNRGLCAQPCRKLYKSNVGNYQSGGYLLSASDICGLDTAKQLMDAGVTTFKIEGRNRRSEYAGATSRVYSKLFENNFEYDDCDRNLLLETFNRGELPKCNYLYGKNDGIVYPQVQNHLGIVVGTIKQGKIHAITNLQKGDGLKIFDGEKEVCGGYVTGSGSGLVNAEFSARVRDGMTVRRTSSVLLSDDILNTKQLLPITLKFSAFAGSCATLTASCGETEVAVTSEWCAEKARQTPTTSEEISKQLSKTAEFRYTISHIVVDIGDIFIAKSQINSLRRQAFELLSKEIVREYNQRFDSRCCVKKIDLPQPSARKQLGRERCLAVICYTEEQVRKMLGQVSYVIFKPQVLDEKILQMKGLDCYLDLPSFCDISLVKHLLSDARFGLVCHNVGQVQLARELGLSYIVGSGLNIFNDKIADIFSDADAFFYSQELTLSEISAFENKGGLTFVDGDIVLMKLVHCPYKVVFGGTCASCKATANLLTYTDEFGNSFEIRRRIAGSCSFELVNGKKLSVVGKLNEGGRYCVDYDEAVVAHYLNLNNGTSDGYTCNLPHTKGRLYNKIN